MNDFMKDWNWELKPEDEGPKLILPGVYPARISWFDQGEFPGSARMPACPKAMLTLLVDTGEEAVEVKCTLLVHPKMAWRLSEFFRAIGRKKHGEPLRMDWTGLVGLPLVVKINHRSFLNNDGEKITVNNIEKFMDFDPAMFPSDPDWLSEAMASDVKDDELDDLF